MDECITCELTSQRHAGGRPVWDDIYQGQFWDVVHSYNSGLAGWLVLIARRHIVSIDEMTEAEALELGQLIRQVSIALKAATGCVKTYVAQFAEATGHNHVHFHLVARMADQPDDRRGPNVFKYLGMPTDTRVSEAAMNELAAKIRAVLLDGKHG